MRIAHAIDALNRFVGKIAYWLVLLAVLISAGNAVSRKAWNLSSNAMLESSGIFSPPSSCSAPATRCSTANVRVDLFYSRMSRRRQLWVEIIGAVLFLLPVVTLILVLSWPPFMHAFQSGEVSANAGGLIRWPVKLLIPIGFALLLLQGLSELIKDLHELRRLPRRPSARNRQ